MLVLVCYDVSTETKSGRRRLRRVARVCESTRGFEVIEHGMFNAIDFDGPLVL